MNPLLILGGLGAVALYLWSQSGSSGSSASNTLPPAPPTVPSATLASTQQGTVPYSGGYGTAPPGSMQAVDPTVANAAASGAQPVANNAPPGAPTGATTTSGAPLFHTGYSDANSGAVIASDGTGTGNPYLV